MTHPTPVASNDPRQEALRFCVSVLTRPNQFMGDLWTDVTGCLRSLSAPDRMFVLSGLVENMPSYSPEGQQVLFLELLSCKEDPLFFEMLEKASPELLTPSLATSLFQIPLPNAPWCEKTASIVFPKCSSLTQSTIFLKWFDLYRQSSDPQRWLDLMENHPPSHDFPYSNVLFDCLIRHEHEHLDVLLRYVKPPHALPEFLLDRVDWMTVLESKDMEKFLSIFRPSVDQMSRWVKNFIKIPPAATREFLFQSWIQNVSFQEARDVFAQALTSRTPDSAVVENLDFLFACAPPALQSKLSKTPMFERLSAFPNAPHALKYSLERTLSASPSSPPQPSSLLRKL